VALIQRQIRHYTLCTTKTYNLLTDVLALFSWSHCHRVIKHTSRKIISKMKRQKPTNIRHLFNCPIFQSKSKSTSPKRHKTSADCCSSFLQSPKQRQCREGKFNDVSKNKFNIHRSFFVNVVCGLWDIVCVSDGHIKTNPVHTSLQYNPQTLASFYARQHIYYSAYMPRQFRLSVRLSHACFVSKQLNASSKFFHYLIGPLL